MRQTAEEKAAPGQPLQAGGDLIVV